MDEGSFVKSFDAGTRIEIHAAQGFVPTKIISFLMNLHMEGKPVFIRWSIRGDAPADCDGQDKNRPRTVYPNNLMRHFFC